MGEGFFVLGNPIGRDTDDQDLSFSRDGSFQLDRLGNIVTTDGLPLLGVGQSPINIPFKSSTDKGEAMLTEVSVNNDGIIEATYGLDTRVEAGKVILADFINEFGLKNIGNSRFQQTGESGIPTFAAPKEETWEKYKQDF